MSASRPSTRDITRRHFAARGVQAECIKLNGAMELAPALGLCRRIVDLVSTGATLQGQRPGRDRAHRRRHLAPDRQPRGAEDAPREIAPLDRAASPRSAACRLQPARRSTAPRRLRRAPSPRLLARQARRGEAMSTRVVAAIIADVRARGDAALLEYTARFDRVDADGRRCCASDRARDRRRRRRLRAGDAARRCELAAERIARLPPAPDARPISTIPTRPACGSAARWTPLDAVGLYVPGGTAAYPSSVLMNAMPGQGRRRRARW